MGRRNEDQDKTPFAPNCPHCKSMYRQTKAGRAVNGHQRYQCQDCRRYYVQENRRYRYPLEVRKCATKMHAEGMGFREIARALKVNHQSVANWVASAQRDAMRLASAPCRYTGGRPLSATAHPGQLELSTDSHSTGD